MLVFEQCSTRCSSSVSAVFQQSRTCAKGIVAAEIFLRVSKIRQLHVLVGFLCRGRVMWRKPKLRMGSHQLGSFRLPTRGPRGLRGAVLQLGGAPAAGTATPRECSSSSRHIIPLLFRSLCCLNLVVLVVIIGGVLLKCLQAGWSFVEMQAGLILPWSKQA